MRKVKRIGSSFFQETYLKSFTPVTMAQMTAREPHSAVASPYEGIKKGAIDINVMPKPKPVTLWMKVDRKVKIKIRTTVVILIL